MTPAGRALALLGISATLCAAGCAHVQVPQRDGLTFAQRTARLRAIPAWHMRGRLAVSTGQGGFQGSFSWVQTGRRLALTVRGPLGAGVLAVAGSPAELTVTARGQTRVLENPETDLSRLIGWWIPVESLPDWLVGLPDPDYRAALAFGAARTLAAFTQRQWHVEYASYQLLDGVLVPRTIDMKHEALELKLTVDRWAPAATGPTGTSALN